MPPAAMDERRQDREVRKALAKGYEEGIRLIMLGLISSTTPAAQGRNDL